MIGEVKFLAGLGSGVVMIALIATVSMVLGNPTAINAVIGCGFSGTCFLAAAALLHGLSARPRSRNKPDYDKIDRLEEELGMSERPKPRPLVVRRVEIDGVSTEYRSWGA
jgi:hypothetical protein